MTSIWTSAASSAALAMVVALAFTLFRERRRADPSAALEALHSLEGRLTALADEAGALRSVLDERGAETARLRLAAEIGSSLDLDQTLARLLSAVTESTGADAALVVMPQEEDDEPLAAAVGLTRADFDSQLLQWPTSSPKALTIVYENVPAAGAEAPIGASIVVPFGDADDGRRGSLAAYWRGRPGSVETHSAGLELLAAAAEPAVRSARRYRSALIDAETDALTGLHNRRHFHDRLAQEIARTRRYERPLALLLVDIDSFDSLNSELGHLRADDVLAAVGASIGSVVRAADTACRIGGDEFAIILPESGVEDAMRLFQRLRRAVSAGVMADITVSGGIAGLDSDDDSSAMFERADTALFEAKQRGRAQVVIASSVPDPQSLGTQTKAEPGAAPLP